MRPGLGQDTASIMLPAGTCAAAAGSLLVTGALIAAARHCVSPVQRLPAVRGSHTRLGTRRLRVGANGDGPFVQCIYPAADDAGAQAGSSWYTPPHSAGGLGVTLGSRFLEWAFWALFSYQRHPDVEGAACVTKEKTPGGRGLPVVIFSHGLHGTSDMYLQACRDIASFGAYVIAVEHEDGTSSYNPRVRPYQTPPKSMNYSVKEEVVEFRKPFLETRAAEVDQVLAWVNAGDDEVSGVVDPSRVVLAGHSFGAATSLQYGYDKRHNNDIKALLLYDVWDHPLKDGVHAASRPVLSVQSEVFATNDEAAARAARLPHETSSHSHSFYIPSTTHNLWCDYSLLLPHYINPLVKFSSPLPQHEAWVDATHRFLKHYVATDAGGEKPLDIPLSEHRLPVTPKGQ